MLSDPPVGILIHHAGPQILDELNVSLMNDTGVLSEEMLGDNNPKLLNRSKLVTTREDVDGVFARVRRDDVPVVGLLEGVVAAALGLEEGGEGGGEGVCESGTGGSMSVLVPKMEGKVT